MCKKQTSVSDSSTESEIISLDAGLRMDGIPPLDLWWWEVLHSSNYKTSSTQEASGNRSGSQEAAGNLVRMSNAKLKKKGNRNVEQLSTWITWPQTQLLLNVKRSCAFLKTSKLWSTWSSKAESPTMRHVRRTHRVALDWLFERINLDPKIQIKYVDTKNQLADMWTKGSFTRPSSSIVEHPEFLDVLFAAIFFQTEGRASELRKAQLKKVRPWRNRDGWVLVPRNFLSAKESPPQDSSASNSPGNQELDQNYVHRAPGNWCETTKTQQHILKSGDKMTFCLRAPGHWCGVVNLQAQQAAGNWSEVVTFKS